MELASAKSVKKSMEAAPAIESSIIPDHSSDTYNDVEKQDAMETPILDIDGLDANIRQCQKLLRSMAAYHFVKGIHSPVYYHLSCVANWLPIRSLPINSNGVTLLDRPSDEVAQKSELLAKKAPAEAITYLGAIMAANPFWLAGQYKLNAYMKMWGEDFDQARSVLREETKSLLARFSELTNMKFADGAPFLDGDTKDWLLASEPLAPPQCIGAGDDEDDAVLTILAMLQEPGSGREIMQRVQRAISTVSSGRQRFKICISLVDYCMTKNKYDEAVQLLNALEYSARKQDLVRWDPDLYREFIKIMSVIYQRISGKDQREFSELKIRVDALLRKHGTIDPILLVMCGE